MSIVGRCHFIALLLMALCTAANAQAPTLTDFWNGHAEWVQDASQIGLLDQHGSYMRMHSPSMFWEGNEIWCYFIHQTWTDPGPWRSTVARARSTDGLVWTYDGIVLDIPEMWQWNWEAESSGYTHQIGRLDGDGWSASTSLDNIGILGLSPVTTDLPDGPCTAAFNLQIDTRTGTNSNVCQLNIMDADSGQPLLTKFIRRAEFNADRTYQRFYLSFTAVKGHSYNFRVIFQDTANIKLDCVSVGQGSYPFWDGCPSKFPDGGISYSTFPGVLKDNGTYYLVYEGSPGSYDINGAPHGQNIGLATSTDGLHFIRSATNPIFTHGENINWEWRAIGTPSIYKDGNTWYLFYHGFDTVDCQIGGASGPDLLHLTKFAENPIIPTVSDTWESGTTGDRSTIYKEGDYHYMVYEGSTEQEPMTGYINANWSSGMARSRDLIHWEKCPANPVIPIAVDKFGYCMPEMIKINGYWHIYALYPENSGDQRQDRFKLVWKNDVPSVGNIKTLPNDTQVALRGKVMYFKGNGFGYVEDTDQTSGIRIEGSIPQNEMEKVDIFGVLKTSEGGERYVQIIDIQSNGYGEIKEYGGSNISLESDILDGMFIKAWGRVQPGSITSDSFILTDGSAGPGVLVKTPGVPVVTEGEFTIVSGAAGRDGLRVIYAK